MLECWTYSGLATRMITPLGLNVRSAEYALKSVMLPPPADALEREERRVTVWMAFYHDTVGLSLMPDQKQQVPWRALKSGWECCFRLGHLDAA
jgi:hypothetical protein